MSLLRRAHVARLLALTAISLSLVLGASGPALAATEAQRVVSVAKSKLGAPWVYGATGPYAYDCSGFVFDVFRDAGLLTRIGGTRRTARGYWQWFADRGLASRYNGRVGDLIIWGSGKHMGIYLGDGRAISALTSGVRTHGLHNLTSSFTTFLHVRLGR